MAQNLLQEIGTMINTAINTTIIIVQYTIMVLELVDGGTMIVLLYNSTMCTNTLDQSTSMASIMLCHSLKSKSDLRIASFKMIAIC